MLIGPIVNSGAIILGGLLGGFLGVKMPERLRTSLPQTFGLCSMALGVVLLVLTSAAYFLGRNRMRTAAPAMPVQQ